MAEDRTLGLARAQDQTAEEPSKQELQRRLEEARDSISHTVTEIKESVSNQVQAVKETLDWREQFKKRPVAWSAGALGLGFLTGYCIASMVKGDERDYYSSAIDRYNDETKSYAAQPVLRAGAAASAAPSYAASSYSGSGIGSTHENGEDEDDGPGLFQRLTSTPAYERVKSEAGNVGDAIVQELSKTAKTVVLPALMTSLRNFIGGYLPTGQSSGSQSAGSASKMSAESDRARSGTASSYQPTLENS